MKGFEEFFRGKKITVMGLGLLGRGVGDAEFLAPLAKELIITDKKTEIELAPSVERLRKFPNITLRLGGHEKEDFTNTDMVIKAAGVPLNSSEIAEARAAKTPVYMSTALFAKCAVESGAVVVGVTGTRGKSTVAHMLFHALQTAGRRAHLGGNIRGKSTLALLPEVQKGDICVLELDSWQLQGFGDLKISPHIAVFTNLMPDHFNYYKGDMNAYFADKANIFKFQKPSDVLIAGASIAERIRADMPPLDPIVPEPIPRDLKLEVLGEHNRENASHAAAALFALGLSEEDIREGLQSFKAVEGRLQLVRELNGVKIYNDNNATTPEATIAALAALRESRSKNKESGIILIAGGADKGLDMSGLAKEINNSCKAIVLLEGTGTQKLDSKLDSRFLIRDSSHFGSLDSAVAKALELAAPDNVILFSPAFASFGMFKNEYDRNDQFLTLVRELKAA